MNDCHEEWPQAAAMLCALHCYRLNPVTVQQLHFLLISLELKVLETKADMMMTIPLYAGSKF